MEVFKEETSEDLISSPKILQKMKLNPRLKNVIFYLLKIGITVGLLIFLFSYEELNISDVILHIKTTNLFYFSIALFLFGFNYCLGILRWNLLLRGNGVVIPISRIAKSYLMGLAVNLFVPSTVGGDLARGIDLSVYSSSSKSKILATVILDRLSGYIAVVIICFVSLLLGYKFVNDKSVLIAFGILVIILFAILLILFNRKVSCIFQFIFKRIEAVTKIINNFSEALSQYCSAEKLKIIIYTLSLSLVIQFIAIIIPYFLSQSLNFNIDMIYFFIFIPIITAVSMIPLTVSGLGSRDISSVYFFARVGYPASYAETISLIIFSFFILTGVIGGVVYVVTLHPGRIQHNKTAASS